jgi:2-hydroxycyclohexanecarboxyl-CoA dehydrogenase
MSGRVALVTGAAVGIGRAIALRLAREGLAVGVLDVNAEGCARVAGEIEANGGKGIALAASVADRGEVTAAVARLRAAFGPVTVLVNNAGINHVMPFEQITDADWDRLMGINLKGSFITTQVVLPDMKAAGWGRIINISSSGAQTGAERISVYAASKGGMISFTRALAHELGPSGITVNSIAPSIITDTDMANRDKDVVPLSQELMLKTLPVRRTGVSDDIANGVAWLVKEESSYVTGQLIGINGGRVMA